MGKKLATRAEDYSKWYNELVVKADLAENSAVRGCMVIKPYGYAIWEKMQAELKTEMDQLLERARAEGEREREQILAQAERERTADYRFLQQLK